MSRYQEASETYSMDAVLRCAPEGYCQWCGKLLPKRCRVFCPSIIIGSGHYAYRRQECASAYIGFWQAIPRFKRVIFIRDNFTCQICGLHPTFENKHGLTLPDIGELAIDHIYPHSKGGLTKPANLQVLCRRDNSKKRDKVGEFAAQGSLL